jgi:hypothetical protein
MPHGEDLWRRSSFTDTVYQVRLGLGALVVVNEPLEVCYLCSPVDLPVLSPFDEKKTSVRSQRLATSSETGFQSP